MSEETKEQNYSSEEIQTASGMDSSEFEAKLTEFFTKHKESKLRLVPRLVKEFKGHENEVLEHLHNKYVLGIATEKPKKKHKAKAENSHSESEAAAEEKPKKSKKKLVMIIVLVVVVGGLGAGGFLMKDKLFGKKAEEAKTETPATDAASVAEQPKQETSPEAATDSVPAAETAEPATK